MNSIWSHRRLRFVMAGAATLVTGAALASAALAGLHALDLGPAAASQYPGKKVTVCHQTHSKKHPWVQIRISTHALKAHLRHGDFVVDATHPCPPTGPTSAKNKDQGKGKHGKGSAAKNKTHGKNNGGKGNGKLGKSGATTNKSHGGKDKGTLGKSGATKNKSHGGKGKGKLGKSGAAKNQGHGNNNGGKGHGKK